MFSFVDRWRGSTRATSAPSFLLGSLAVASLLIVSASVAAPLAVGANAGADPGSLPRAPGGPFLDDPVLAGLLTQATEARPELRRGRARLAAERARVPQAQTLADPVLTLGIQNDGFTRLQIGKMETSWTTIAASQTLPWFGKRERRAGVVDADVRRAEAELARATLDVRAEVERAYLALLVAKAEAELFARTDALWSQSEGMARVRYETGDGAQSDLLRAELARSRLRLRRLALDAETARRLLVIDRLRGVAGTAPLGSTRRLTDLADPPVPDLARALADARAASPELHGADDERERARRQLSLVRTDSYPDVTLSAGVMPRGGPFETMWQAGVSLNLPVWSLDRNAKAVAESQARIDASDATKEALGALLDERVRERHTMLVAVLETIHLYRSGLLIQSDATVSSTLAQYRVGKVPMTAVLEAMSGYLGDMDGFLGSIAAAQRLAIAEREVSLADPGSALDVLAGSGGSGATTMEPGKGLDDAE